MTHRGRGKATFFPGKRPAYIPYARSAPAPAKARREEPSTTSRSAPSALQMRAPDRPAGCVKTHTLKRLHALSPHETMRVTVLSGLAARNLECGATTRHSFAGIRVTAARSAEDIAACILKDPDYKWMKLRILRTRRLFIDEISTASAQFLEKCEHICQIVHANHPPFGGIQVHMCGTCAWAH